MRLTKSAIVKVIDSARIALDLSEETRLIGHSDGFGRIDIMAGNLCDALFEMNDEFQFPDDDFEKSLTMRLIKSKLDSETVADIFMKLTFRKENDRDI